MVDVFKAILLGIIEGITEWLPISSTGHLILTNKFLQLGVSDAFLEMFEVVIQLGAIFAVILLFWNKLWPFTTRKDSTGIINIHNICGIKKQSVSIWLKVAVACIPTILIAFPFEKYIEPYFLNQNVEHITVSIMLIVYGIIFIVVENANKNHAPKIATMQMLSYKTAFFIGCFQALAVIPGTSRSGSTILGAMLIGLSRTVAAEFSFYLAVPTMFGASLLKILDFGFQFTGTEIVILAAGMITSFVVSLLAIKFLLGFVKKHSFASFGYYRIVLGIAVLLYFALVNP